MKVYFSATVTDDETYKALYEKIIQTIQKSGHKVLEYGAHKIDPQELLNRSETDIKKVYKELDKFLKQADVYITDISLPSVGIGYEISQAIASRKPVLALNYEKKKYQPLATLEGNKSKYLRYETYNENNIEEIIKSFLKDAKEKLDTKFILIIPPEIDQYLQWASDYKRMHKAQIVRDAVDAYMGQDEDWQEFLKEEA